MAVKDKKAVKKTPAKKAVKVPTEKEVLKMRVKPINISNGLGYAIGLVIYTKEN